jgi:hypothetical protein
VTSNWFAHMTFLTRNDALPELLGNIVFLNSIQWPGNTFGVSKFSKLAITCAAIRTRRLDQERGQLSSLDHVTKESHAEAGTAAFHFPDKKKSSASFAVRVMAPDSSPESGDRELESGDRVRGTRTR